MIEKKIFKDVDELRHQVQNWKNNGLSIVFTNGCFDLIHLGHVLYLEEAKGLGDKLIVAINSDASTAALKGPHRPIQDQKNRTTVIAAMQSVDAVIIFEEPTPIDIITNIMPDYLVKGGDWPIDQIVGANLVMENGGKVLTLPFYNGNSTTSIEQKIIALHQSKVDQS